MFEDDEDEEGGGEEEEGGDSGSDSDASSHSGGGGHMDLDGDDFEGGDIEAAAKRLESRRARVAADADAEMRLAADAVEGFVLPSRGELDEERAQPPNLRALKRRLDDLVFVLSDFRSRRDPRRAREEYVECFAGDLADYYSYNRELVDIFCGLFSPAEALQFFEANETPRPGEWSGVGVLGGCRC